MRKVLLMALMLTVMTASVAFAEMKIGVFDMQIIGVESEIAKEARKTMESKYGAEKKEIEAQAKTLQAKGEALQKKPTEAKQVEFVKLKRAFDEKNYNFSRNVEADDMKIRQDIITLTFKAAYEVAQAKGLNFVVDITGGGVFYADKTMDVTSDVLAEVNKLYKAGAHKTDK